MWRFSMQLAEKYQLIRKLARSFAETELTPEILDALATCQKRNMEVQGMKDFSGIWLEICQDNVS